MKKNELRLVKLVGDENHVMYFEIDAEGKYLYRMSGNDLHVGVGAVDPKGVEATDRNEKLKFYKAMTRHLERVIGVYDKEFGEVQEKLNKNIQTLKNVRKEVVTLKGKNEQQQREMKKVVADYEKARESRDIYKRKLITAESINTANNSQYEELKRKNHELAVENENLKKKAIIDDQALVTAQDFMHRMRHLFGRLWFMK